MGVSREDAPMSNLFAAAHFHDETAARTSFEAIRWPDGRTCPHCGVLNHSYATKRAGLYRCAEKECRKDFTVKNGTVMESSHIPLTKWMMGFYMMSASKKGVSSHQMHRALGVTYQTAWFMTHRIREAMRAGGLAPLGGTGKAVEVDETFIGRLEGVPKQRKRGGTTSHKNTVLTLVERGGSARSFHVDGTTVADIAPILKANISRMSRLNTDEAKHYHEVGGEFVSHDAVNHGEKEYVRYEDGRLIGTNTVEGFYSIFKRGMKGIYQHCAEKHLNRYLSEFDFRYSNRIKLGVDDVERTRRAIKGAEGKRLTYRQPH
jgi:transposase-like protein